MSKDEFVTLYESWEKVDGVVYYKWKVPEEKEWHWKKTPYTESPVVQWKKVTPEEYESIQKEN